MTFIHSDIKLFPKTNWCKNISYEFNKKCFIASDSRFQKSNWRQSKSSTTEGQTDLGHELGDEAREVVVP